MDDNYYALFLCIIKEMSVNESLLNMGISVRDAENHNAKYTVVKFTKEDILEMFALRKTGLTYKKIGEKFGISGTAALKRMIRGTHFLKEDNNKECGENG